jgi:flagellar hook-associated protein 1 FlgK
MGSNYTSKILNNAVRSLSVQQAVIAATGNNIANVNTDGYTRRSVQLETALSANTGQLNIGSGVSVAGLIRRADEYLNASVRTALGDSENYSVQQDIMDRVEALFDLTGQHNTINSALSGFFQAAEDLATDPASLELRANFIERGNDLASAISTTMNSLISLQTEAQERIDSDIGVINSLTEQIATLNGKVTQGEATGEIAADARDQRDRLLEQLAEKVSFDVVEQDDGSINVFLGNGFPLVSGTTSRSLSTTTAPSFGSGNSFPGMGGINLSYIVYDYSGGAGTADFDLTSVIASGSGSLSGLLSMRGVPPTSLSGSEEWYEVSSGTIPAIAQRVEALTHELLTTFNQAYVGYDTSVANNGDEDTGTAGHQASSGDLNDTSPGVFGLFTFSGASDVNSDGLADSGDITDSSMPNNLSSVLQFGISDPSSVAAARDVDATEGATSFQDGDGRIIEQIAALGRSTHSFSLGSYSLTGATFDQQYNDTVTYVGNQRARIDVNANVAESSLLTAQDKRDQLSKVSLDEEFTNLIKFQKAFEASARMVRTASELLDTLVSII